jgi:hypothetical protein
MPSEMGVSSSTEEASASHHREERVDDGSGALVADLLFLLARGVGDGALDTKQRADEAEGCLGALGSGSERFGEIPPGVRPIE